VPEDFAAMSDSESSDPELQRLKQSIHELNNGVGIILAMAELMQLEALPSKAAERARQIEEQAIVLRELLFNLSEHYFS
jgi:hypothetical protein